jgi:hypothetical protein
MHSFFNIKEKIKIMYPMWDEHSKIRFSPTSKLRMLHNFQLTFVAHGSVRDLLRLVDITFLNYHVHLFHTCIIVFLLDRSLSMDQP